MAKYFQAPNKLFHKEKPKTLYHHSTIALKLLTHT